MHSIGLITESLGSLSFEDGTATYLHRYLQLALIEKLYNVVKN